LPVFNPTFLPILGWVNFHYFSSRVFVRGSFRVVFRLVPIKIDVEISRRCGALFNKLGVVAPPIALGDHIAFFAVSRGAGHPRRKWCMRTGIYPGSLAAGIDVAGVGIPIISPKVRV
jgi:hypothetical protein